MREWSDEMARYLGLRRPLAPIQRDTESRFRICSVCRKPVKADPRGDVLDASGRCDECQP